MLTLLDPQVIEKETGLIEELRKLGIDHLATDSDWGWNYVLDHVWIATEVEKYIVTLQTSGVALDDLVVLDVGCGNSLYHNFLEEHYGLDLLGIDRPDGYCKQAEQRNVDYFGDFIEMNYRRETADIIIWLSSLEHNRMDRMRQLFMKSMECLKPGGLFLATIPLAEQTGWFAAAEQTNLSVHDALELFGETRCNGKFTDIKSNYCSNLLNLKDKYTRRFDKFFADSPAYIIGGIQKNKEADMDLAGKPTEKVCMFAPSNDSHVHWMKPIADKLNSHQFMVIPSRKEQAEECLIRQSEGFFNYRPGLLAAVLPDVIVLGNDWSIEENQILTEAKILGIPSVCIQEGVVDFADRAMNRMHNADYGFLQGPKMLECLSGMNFVVTGNPKYDDLYPTPFPEQMTALINSNFTYHIYEDIRDQWIKYALDACSEAGISCFISQHPRDSGSFPPDVRVIKSNAFKVKEQLEQCSIVISRFSTMIYEAAAVGREVIYFNPYGERSELFNNDKTETLLLARNYPELVERLHQAVERLRRPEKRQPQREKFLLQNIATLNHDAADKIVQKLLVVTDAHSKSKGKNHLHASGEQNKLYRLYCQLIKRLNTIKEYRSWLNSQVQNWQKAAEDTEKVVQEQKVWISDLEKAKSWLEEQSHNWQQVAEEKDKVLQSQQNWISDLEKAKLWLEEQSHNWQQAAEEKDKVLQSQLIWINELKTGKAQLEEQLKAYQQTIQELQDWIKELEQGKAWLISKQQAWQKTAEEQQAWIKEIENGKTWLEEQRANWQELAQEREERITLLEAKQSEWQKQMWFRLGVKLGLLRSTYRPPQKEQGGKND